MIGGYARGYFFWLAGTPQVKIRQVSYVLRRNPIFFLSLQFYFCFRALLLNQNPASEYRLLRITVIFDVVSSRLVRRFVICACVTTMLAAI